MKKIVLASILVAFLAPGLVAQEKSKEKKEPPKKLNFDFRFDYDPRELHEYSQDYNRWKKIKGIFGVGSYHIPVGHVHIPYKSPPLTIWGQGFGTSLWRDPVTGWPTM